MPIGTRSGQNGIVGRKLMQSLDFVLVVVPLSCIVVTLTMLVYYYAHREEFNKRKTAKLIQGFLEKRVEQQAAIRRELGKVNEMYKIGSINEGIYQRLQNVLEMTQEKQRFEAILMLDEKKGKGKKQPQISLEKILAETEQEVSLEKEKLSEEQEMDKGKLENKPMAKQPQRSRTRKGRTRKKKIAPIELTAVEIAPESTDKLENPSLKANAHK